jgi:MoxR-like ATPase
VAGALELIENEVREKSVVVDRVINEVERVLVGQRELLEGLLIGLLTKGHVLVEGIPGLAKTLAVKSLASTLHASFQRIQFTPDLLPADLIGTQIYDPKSQSFQVQRGPIFANLVLADEINRAPAKVQSALLEAMQERQVTLGKTSYKLEEPFLVLATQNPIEQEGTYPLPEAQVDRFELKITVGYPDKADERKILDRMSGLDEIKLSPVASVEEILHLQAIVDRIYIDPRVKDYIVNLVHSTRLPKEYNLKQIDGLLSYGASPRASIALVRAAKAHAFLRHRGFVTPDDVKAIAPAVMRHRILLSYEAEAEGVSADDVLSRILQSVEVP